MRRLFLLGLLIASASMSMGCAMCCSPYDYAYPYYGGRWQRDNLCNGRVGSAFDPAGSPVIPTKQQAAGPVWEPSELPSREPSPEKKPNVKPNLKPNTKPDDMTTEVRPLKSVKRARPANLPRPYLPVND